MTGYDAGHCLGEMMAKQRAKGNHDYDCRYDLADAAKEGKPYFKAFKAGLEAALTEGRQA